MTNSTIPTTTPDVKMDINLFDLDDIIAFKDSIIKVINDFLTTLAPNWEVQVIIALSILTGIIIKKKYDEDNVFAVIVSVVVFLALRGIGIGG